jgi:UPF0755 protein
MANSGQIRSKYEPTGTNSLEGLVFPDTYQVASTDTEQSVLQRLVNQMQKVGAQTGLDKLPADQAYQDLIIASIVEREAKVDADRPKIARVILNRLDLGMPLQVDATLFYGQDPKTPFDELKAKDTPYNTYLHTGLPPTPISAPGAASIKAVLNPDPPLAEDACPTNKPGEPCELLFYVLSPDGKTHAFATNVRDQQKNVDAWHAAGSPGA